MLHASNCVISASEPCQRHLFFKTALSQGQLHPRLYHGIWKVSVLEIKHTMIKHLNCFMDNWQQAQQTKLSISL